MNVPAEISPEIRVLVADDSAVMRTALSRMLESSPLVRVCGTARNGLETVEKIKRLKPDVVTLDVEMPVLDGIDAQASAQNATRSTIGIIIEADAIQAIVVLLWTITTDGYLGSQASVCTPRISVEADLANRSDTRFQSC